MAEFDQLAEILETGWGQKGLAAAEPLKAGRVWRVTLATDRTYVLKNWGKRDAGLEERVEFFQSVMRHVTECGVPAEVALPSTNGHVIYRSAGEAWWLTNELPNNASPLAPDEILILQRNYGRSIASLHRALATYPEEIAHRKTWSKDVVRELAEQHLPSIRARLASSERKAFEEMVAPHEREVAAHLEGLPRQLIFYDCHHGNILRDGCAVSGFVDADHLSFGMRIWDLSYFIAQGIHDIQRDRAAEWPHHARVTVAAYEEVNPLSDRERAAIWHGMFAFKINMLALVLGGSQLDSKTCLFDHLQRLNWIRPYFT
jgi:Ser/Thr protein kinase RdoA (MazF antagonist)